MNSGVIIAAEVKVFPATTFTPIDIIPFSGDFNEPSIETNAGKHYEYKGVFSIAKIHESTDEFLSAIEYRKATYRITDGNGTKHLIGDGLYPARLFYSREIAPQAGGFNGYRCTVTRRASTRTTIDTGA